MAHVVEDGTGLSTANAYASAVEGDVYFADHGAPAAWTGPAAPAKEQAIRLATQALDVSFANKWKGGRLKATQALQWPRFGVWMNDGWYLAHAPLPAALKVATFELALRSLQGDTLIPDLAANTAAIHSESVEAGSVSYSVVYDGAGSPVKTYSIIAGLLSDLVMYGGEVIRA